MSRVAIIPARGGSKRIPGKNIRPFYGKPMLAYPIQAAQRSGLFDAGVWVSTEDKAIAEVAHYYGANVIHRPPELAEIGAPDCGTQEVTRHALMNLPFHDRHIITHACCIYPCTPMLLPQDLIRAAVRMDPHPYAYVPGIFYWGNAWSFLNRVELAEGVEMPYPPERYIDINTEDDWQRAELMMADLMIEESAP